ncbi:MAG TPA: cytochrome P450 [Jatrophihabitantaceae bacterium]|jgi:cytochrome P450
MTAIKDSDSDSTHADKRAAGPVVDFADLMQCPVPRRPFEHFGMIDTLRETDAIHFGDASGHPFWAVTRMAPIREAFQHPEIFSNNAVVPDAPEPPYYWIPEMLDAPLHNKWRKLLGPFFSPGTVEALEPKMRERFAQIIDDVAPRGRCDFIQDVALKFPNQIFMEIMGMPVTDAQQFQEWETAILHEGSSTSARAAEAMGGVHGYFSEVIAARREEPKQDIISETLSWTIDGEPISDEDMMAFCLLMFMAGLDTVSAQLGYSFLHLATNPDDRRRINEDPALIAPAMEEFLRYYAFVTPGRKVKQDTELAGCPIKAGEMVFLPLVAANRDPDEFPDADKVIIDRQENRHIAFGAGPHRCLGSHLARTELNIALEEWHKRVPDYRVDESIPIREHGGQIGLSNLPLVWDV